MTTFATISKVVTAAAFVIWAFWTEWRMRRALSDNANLRRALDKANIKTAVESESDDELRTELDKDVRGG